MLMPLCPLTSLHLAPFSRLLLLLLICLHKQLCLSGQT
jgi:hypothetical protein